MTPDIRWSLAIGDRLRLWSDDEPGFLDNEDWDGGDGLIMEEAPADVDGQPKCSLSISVARKSLQDALWAASAQRAEVRWWWRADKSGGIGGWRSMQRRFLGRVGQVRIARDRCFLTLELEPYLVQVDSRTWTHDDQQLRHPDDTGMRRIEQYADYGFPIHLWLDSEAAPVNS